MFNNLFVVKRFEMQETNSDSNRKLASIQIVKSIEKHTNASSLELCTILGWQIVTRIKECKVGDIVVYCEIDSVLPNAKWIPEAIKKKISESNKNTFRLKTVKLRKEYSQGLIIMLDKSMPFDISVITEDDIGMDVTQQLGIIKYESPALKMTNINQERISNFCKFPSELLQKTDETRVQSNPKLFKLMQKQAYYASVKCDGASASFVIDPCMTSNNEKDSTKLLVCSRNFIRERPIDVKSCHYWYIAEKYYLKEKLSMVPDFAIQGEICGPGLHKNLLGLKDLELFVFNVVDIRDKKKLSLKDMLIFCKKMDLQTVPIEEVGDSFHYKSLKDVLDKAEGLYKHSKRHREGLVYRSQDQSISFKAINNRYLLNK